jgi:uncharacterized protein YcbK (DUF882 family)
MNVYSRDEADKRISLHFKAGDFFCPCGKCENQYIDELLVSKLEIIWTRLNKRIYVQCGYMCSEFNDVKTELQHIKGIAADCSVNGISIEDLRKVAEDVIFGGIGVYPTFLHVDVRQGRSRWNG